MIPKETVLAAFAETYGGADNVETYFSPGRVNLIGEHIDYSGGKVLPAALTLGITAAVRRRTDGVYRFISREEKGPVEFGLDGLRKRFEGWGAFPHGVVTCLLDVGRQISGCDVYYASDLPERSGLASSAAIEVLTAYLLLYPIFGEDLDRVWLAKFAQHVEHDAIGVQCGIMDQFAAAMGKPGHAILLDSGAPDFEYVPVELGNYDLAVLDTNKKRELSESKYNERYEECVKAFEILSAKFPVCSLVDASVGDLASIPDETLRRRAHHAVTENLRVARSVELLKAGDVAGFGKLLDLSHRSLRDDYETTGFHLDAIVDAARNADGCVGARMTGVGFGGCAIALVERDKYETFCERAGREYFDKTGIRADFYRPGIGGGAGKI